MESVFYYTAGQSFIVEDVIGKGGFAKVHRVSTGNGQVFAIKVRLL